MSCTDANALLCEPVDAETREEWAYVGAGKGNFEKVENYQYVGNGGSFDKEQVVTYSRWRMRFWLMVLCGILSVVMVGIAYWYFNVQLPGEFDNAAQDVNAQATRVAFDCDAGYWNWKKGWSNVKKQWCCSHHNKGCPETPAR